ncbi:MAG: quinolinate synthase NadA [Planctomycetota bacterium]
MATALSALDLDLEAEIRRLKRERRAIILAHYYQDSEIQDLADELGDSLYLAQCAQKATGDVIVFCGVHFMAETAKILNPGKIVVIPDMEAGCSLADSCPASQLAAWKRHNPDHAVVSYINCSAEVKALSDIICTSSNAERVIRSIPQGKPILFAPDRNLGAWLVKKTGREMTLWQGTCIVHEIFSEKALVQLMAEHPGARVIAHPECEPRLLKHAHFIGSTSALLKFTREDPATEFIIGTEAGILHQMRRSSPGKTFYELPTDEGCACNRCPHMQKNTLEKLYLCLRDLAPRLEMDAELMARARRPLERMLELG